MTDAQNDSTNLAPVIPIRRPEKRAFPELAEAMAAAMNLDAHPFPRPFPKIYRVSEPSPGVRILLEETDGEVLTEVPLERAAHDVVAWTRLMMVPEWFMTPRLAKEVVGFFISIADPIPCEHIRAVRWADESGYTWRRLPWARDCGGAAPTWDRLLSRMTNVQAFIAWIGSTFEEGSNNHQYTWVKGAGSDGKGAINRFFKRVLGRAYRAKQVPPIDDRFWTYGLRGSRLVVFPDCNNQSFVTTGLFKSLSGGDPVDVEKKNGMSFTEELYLKFMFFSNEVPLISEELADLRRLIFCEFEAGGVYEPGFEGRLWDEGGAFLSACIDEYRRVCPNHGPIPTDGDTNEALAAVTDEPFQVFFDVHFKQPAVGFRTSKEMTGFDGAAIKEVTIAPGHMAELLKAAFGPSRREHAAFRSWAGKKYGVAKKKFRALIDVDGGWRYVGICTK